MNNLRQLPDGQWAVELDDGREVSGSDRDRLLMRATELEDAARSPDAFLSAWRAAVATAGVRFFNVTSDSIESATDKNELRPAIDTIRSHAGDLSRGERTFLFAVVSLYNRTVALDLCHEFGDSIDPLSMATRLDRHRLRLVVDLMATYAGW